MRAQCRAPQHVAQLARLAEGIGRLEGHLLDIDIGLKEAVVEHHALCTAGQQRVARREDVRQPHRQLDRYGDLHRRSHLAYDVGIVLLDLRGRSVTVRGQQEDIQLEGRSAGLHRRGVVDPRLARADAVDASDDGHPHDGGILDQLQQFGLVGVTQIAFEVLAGIPVSLHLVQRGGLTVDLLLEDRLQYDGARPVAYALLDMSLVRRVGRTAHNDRTREFESQVFGFHLSMRFLVIRYTKGIFTTSARTGFSRMMTSTCVPTLEKGVST